MTVADVILNKVSTIQRCTARIIEEFNSDEIGFLKNYTKQDSVVLNLQRCCEAAIDIANYLIRKESLGIPQSARDSFELLASSQVITADVADKLKKMVGLRNIAVHDYQQLNMRIVVAVINKHLLDFEDFCAQVVVHQSR